LKLDPARSKLIAGFIDGYLLLTERELKQYEREFTALAPAEGEAAIALVSSWEQNGIEQGIIQGIEQGIERGKEDLVVRLIRRRLGLDILPATVRIAVDKLSSAQLDKLGEALLDFTNLNDLETWLANR
jgi:hypothetical protein